MKDSGSRNQFSTGAVRDDGDNKSRPDLTSPFSLMRLGEWLRKGAEKYDSRNWEKGMPFGRCLEAIDRHFLKYQMGKRDEDHMAAVMCNAMFIMHYEEMIKLGVLPAELDDRADYSRRIQVMLPLPGYATAKYDGARMLLAGEAVAYKESETMDADYGLELADQDAVPVVIGLNPILKDKTTYDKVMDKVNEAQLKKPNCFVPVSKVTGQAMSKNIGRGVPETVPSMIGRIQDVFVLPDENMCNRVRKPACDICGQKVDLKYYRQDLDKSYCTTCYTFNRIDLKPVIRS